MKKALFGGEFARVQRGRDEGAISPTAADFAVHAYSGLEPGRRDDDGVDERALHSVVNRGSCRSLMMPTGIRTIPARMLNFRDEQEVHVGLLSSNPDASRLSTNACSSSSSLTNRCDR
jgi:hypothetical protein